MKTKLILTSMLVLSFAFLSVQCGSKPKKIDTMKPSVEKDRPGWVDKGGAFYDGEKGKAFYGVGAVSGMKNVALRRTAADTQARADISRIFKTHISNLVKIYQREVTDIDKSAAEAFAQEATKGFTSMDLSGAMIVGHYFSIAEGTQYSLAVLDMAGFQNQVEKMNNLSKQVQEAIIKNADKAFDELDKMEEGK